MSRIGKQPIMIPSGVNVTIAADRVTVTGPKGSLSEHVHPKVQLDIADNQVTVSVKDPEEKNQRSLWGLFRRLIANMVIGVTEGFFKQLEINGVGYKAAVSGKVLILQLGYSHPIEYQIPEGIDIGVEKNVITVSGVAKQQVGQIAAEIRSLRKPEPYKGKGIRYLGETIRRKEGKTAAKGAA